MSPSFWVFWLYSRGPDDVRDLAAAGRLADADGVGFAGSAVAVRTATELSPTRVTVETWSRMPLLLPEEPPFDFAAEGSATFPADLWCISESQDAAVQFGQPLPAGAGDYGVRVTAYHRQETVDRLADHPDGLAGALRELRDVPPELAERYRIQLWPVGRPR